jgi:vanillate/3-O-methylgallate O-demethylase
MHMPRLNTAKFREDFAKALDRTRPFYLERPPMFSPAAAAQDAANGSRMLWCWAPIWLPWEYTRWLEEGRSFHDTAYIGDWSALVKVNIKGPQALQFLSHIGTNDLSKFSIGQVKHHVQTNEQGKIAAQGVLYRVAEDQFWYTGGSAYWASYMLKQGAWDAVAHVDTPEHFLFSVQGPQSRTVMERVTGEVLGHLRFNHFATFRIRGAGVRVLRTGVSGELGYELHGPSERGNDVWSAVVEAGAEFGLKQLGVRAQLISHVEAGIATNDRDFVSAAVGTSGAPQIDPTARARILGSYRPADMAELYRTPAELGWYRQVSLDSHDFVGRDALLAEKRAGGPARRLVGLIWNKQDVVDVYATLFGEDPIVAPMELPRYLGLAVDQVTLKGKLVGCSTSRVYSPYLRKMISLGHLDASLTRPGTAVNVIWGDADGPQRKIRATVVELPFKEDMRRKDDAVARSAAK